MKYISIDLETTGLKPESHQILTFSGILEDTSKVLPFEEIPKFNIYILRDDITGSPFAINMNSEMIAHREYVDQLHTAESKINNQLIKYAEQFFGKELSTKETNDLIAMDVYDKVL